MTPNDKDRGARPLSPPSRKNQHYVNALPRDFFLTRTCAKRLKNPFNLNLLRGDDQRRQEHLAERNSDFWSFLRGSLG
jgi:hypothetical protein